MAKWIGIALIILGVVLIIPLLIAATAVALTGSGAKDAGANCDPGGSVVSTTSDTTSDIGPGGDKPPAEYVSIYQQAAARANLGEQGPSILAGIHYEETKFGGSGSNANGGEYVGPMAWSKRYFPAYAVDGNGDGKKDIFNVADAIFTSANHLKKHGAPKDWRGAIYAYNHSNVYVDAVLASARKFDIPATGDAGTVGGGSGCPDDSTAVSGDIQELAQQILNNKNITIQPNPEGSLKAAANGKCSPVPYASDCVKLDRRLLQAILKVAQNKAFTITSLTTGDHETCSNHYQGRAVDLNHDTSLIEAFRKQGANELIDEGNHVHAGWEGPNPICE